MADELSESNDEPLIPIPVPALLDILMLKEREKGEPLTEAEVNDIRDHAVCIMLPMSVAEKMIAARGYRDLEMEFAWEQWRQLNYYRLEAGRFEDFVSYGLKSFAHEGVT